MAYHFGTFMLDYNTRELRRRGVEVRLSPKAFELLAMLVRNRARAMSKAELQAAKGGVKDARATGEHAYELGKKDANFFLEGEIKTKLAEWKKKG